MVRFGPTSNRFKDGRMSFFVHEAKHSKHLPKGRMELNKQFEQIIDHSIDGELVELILALYLRFCPNLVKCFFYYLSPYLELWQYDLVDLEWHLVSSRPMAYELYITRDFCNKMHWDDDVAEFNLCYISHSDTKIGSTRINVLILEYGLWVLLCNGNLWAFRSSIVHGIGDRVASQHLAHVGAITINNGLKRAIAKRKASWKLSIL
jgi:hypothetical protein